jgi:hypothetical protein
VEDVQEWGSLIILPWDHGMGAFVEKIQGWESEYLVLERNLGSTEVQKYGRKSLDSS